MATAQTKGLERRPAEMNGLAAMDPMRLGEVFAKSGWFKDSTDPAKAVVKIIAGRELGLGPMASMVGINIIEGKPALSANLLATQVKRHPAYDFIPREITDTQARIEFFQNGELIGTSEFTMADAERAGIAGKQNFKRYPKAMLFARALSQGVRWYCPDVTAGAPAYVPEELGAEVDGEGEVVALPSPEIAAAESVEGNAQETSEELDPERVKSLMKGIGATGYSFDRLALSLGSLGADAPKINRGNSIAKAIRALTPVQADALEADINAFAEEADRG
jgi:hypothetical protein